MSKHQLILPFVLSEHARFDNFIAAESDETLARMRGLFSESAFTGVWLSGETLGKTHLLQAACHQFGDRGRGAAYLPLGEVRDVDALAGLDAQGLVALDDVDAWLGDEDLERALLVTYQMLLAARGTLVVASRSQPAQTPTHLADLGSRLRGMACYSLTPLTDAQKSRLVEQRAAAKGLRFGKDVLAYWMTHGSRDVRRLLSDLDQVLAVSLQQRRAVTIPWLKSVLGL